METWFWVLGWSLSFLTSAGNGFIIILVCRKRQLRTKTNAFVVSLAVADFFVGLSVVPSLFVCEMATWCTDPQLYGISFIRCLFSYASAMNLCSLVLDRYLAVVKPLKYLTFMSRRRIVQMILLSWVMPVSLDAVSVFIWFHFNMSLIFDVFMWLLTICFEFFPCLMLILCFTSMLSIVCKHHRAARSLAKQLRFNHQNLLKIEEKSAVKIMAIVIGVFLLCYAFYLRCSFKIIFGGSATCDDQEYKVPLLVLNSAINPFAYAFCKRDIKKEIKNVFKKYC